MLRHMEAAPQALSKMSELLHFEKYVAFTPRKHNLGMAIPRGVLRCVIAILSYCAEEKRVQEAWCGWCE